MTTPVPAVPTERELPTRAWAAMFVRLLAIQGSWSYEILLGNGIAFCVEPALRLLPGGRDGDAYRAALARQSQYFNAHPYLAAIAVGALARAEVDGEPPARIDRFRGAMCGPLGSVGDQLVWAGWLPLCSVVALAVYGLGGGAVAVLATFLVLYNVGHLALRAWALQTGWRHGMRVATALANPVFRLGPRHVARAAALIGGFAVPLALDRLSSGGEPISLVVAAVALGAAVLARGHGRIEGWQLALAALTTLVLFSVARHG